MSYRTLINWYNYFRPFFNYIAEEVWSLIIEKEMAADLSSDQFPLFSTWCKEKLGIDVLWNKAVTNSCCFDYRKVASYSVVTSDGQ